MGLFYSKMPLDCNSCCWIWNEEGRGTCQPKPTTERQDWSFRQLALEENRPKNSQHTKYILTYSRLWGFIIPFKISASFDYKKNVVNILTAAGNCSIASRIPKYRIQQRIAILGKHNCQRSVRRRRGEWPDIVFGVEKYINSTVGIMVWGAIIYGSCWRLFF